MHNSNDNIKITTKEHWQYATGRQTSTLQPSEKYLTYFDKYLPTREDWTALEVGACPGGHLLAIALNHHYQPVALDYLSEVQSLPEKFREYGINNLDVIEADFLKFETDKKFNIVMSFGFMEHFENPADILDRHWELVAPGGFLVVGVPIFGPFQILLRRLVLTPEKLAWTLGAHNQEIMDLKVLRGLCETLPDCSKVVFASHVREMEMWFSRTNDYIRRGRIWILYVWKIMALLPQWLKFSCKLFSPYALVILQRQQAEDRVAASEG